MSSNISGRVYAGPFNKPFENESFLRKFHDLVIGDDCPNPTK